MPAPLSTNESELLALREAPTAEAAASLLLDYVNATSENQTDGRDLSESGYFITTSEDQTNGRDLSASGAIDTILFVMRSFPAYAEVQENGCTALFALSPGSNDNQVTIITANGINTILSAMDEHPSHPGVQAMACGVLTNLAFSPENNEAVAAEGGIAAIFCCHDDASNQCHGTN
jgi:hypothetical protein